MNGEGRVRILAVALESWAAGILICLLILAFLYFGYRLSRIDIATHRLPNKLIARWLLGTLVLLATLSAVRMDFWPLLQALTGMLLLGGAYFVLSLLSSGAMGMGDVKLAAVLGLNLGYFSLGALLIATLIAFIAATVVVVVGTVMRRLTFKSEVAFGPFMVLGAIVALAVAR